MWKWKLKAGAQGLLSLLANGERWNDLFIRYVTRRLVLTENRFERKLIQCRNHFALSREATGRPSETFTVLELGTGWYPIIPVGMYLCGASHIWSIDIQPLLNAARTNLTLRWFLDYARDGRLKKFLPFALEERVANLEELVQSLPQHSMAFEILRSIGIEPMVCDVRTVDLPKAGIDFFVSNCVLEHIPMNVLLGIFRKFREIASPGAVMNHLVDLSDHYADFDHSITKYNFLRYPSSRWRFFNNRLHYQNRLQIPDYRRVYYETGFRIVMERDVLGAKEDLESIPLAEEFRHYSPEDLLVVNSRLIAVADT